MTILEMQDHRDSQRDHSMKTSPPSQHHLQVFETKLSPQAMRTLNHLVKGELRQSTKTKTTNSSCLQLTLTTPVLPHVSDDDEPGSPKPPSPLPSMTRLMKSFSTLQHSQLFDTKDPASQSTALNTKPSTQCLYHYFTDGEAEAHRDN